MASRDLQLLMSMIISTYHDHAYEFLGAWFVFGDGTKNLATHIYIKHLMLFSLSMTKFTFSVIYQLVNLFSICSFAEDEEREKLAKEVAKDWSAGIVISVVAYIISIFFSSNFMLFYL